MPQRSPTSRKRASAVSWSARIVARSPSFSASCAEISGAAARTHGSGCSSASRISSTVASRSPTSQDRTARKSTIGGQLDGVDGLQLGEHVGQQRLLVAGGVAVLRIGHRDDAAHEAALGRIGVAVGLQRDADPVQRVGRVAGEHREPHQLTREVHGAPGVAGVGEVAQRRDDVLALGGQQVQRADLMAAAQARRVLVDDRDEVVRVRRADRVEHALLGQALDPVLADRLEHPIARGRRVDDLQERAVDQRGEEVEDLDGRAVVDGRGALRRHAAGEDREPFGERALGLGQQLPAPVDDGAQGAVARQRGAAAAGEDRKRSSRRRAS